MNFAIKPKMFFDDMSSAMPSQPQVFDYGDRPEVTFTFLPNVIHAGDLLVFAVDNDMVFYDSTPENILHSATCMVVVKHAVTAEEATAGSVTMTVETRTVKFRDTVNGKVRPVDVQVGLYLKTGDGQNVTYALLAKGRGVANGIIADYDSLPEPITTDDYYTKDEIDGKLAGKADADDLTSHTSDTDIHVTVADKTAWDSKADLNDIGSATVTITQGGVSKGAFSVNATDDVTVEINDGAQADWSETSSSSPSFILNKPSIYTQSETDTLLGSKADVATTIAGYGITDAYTKTEIDSKVASVYRYKGSVSAYSDLPATGQEVGDVYNIATADAQHGIKAGDNVAWNGSTWDTLAGEIDLSAYATKAELAPVATSGSFNDLSDKPEIPEAEDLTDYLCIETATGASTGGFGINTVGSVNASLEYSYDKETWATLTFNTTISGTNILGTRIYIRGDNNTLSTDLSNYLNFFATNVTVRASGNMMSLLSKDCSKFAVPSFAFCQFFKSCAGLLSAPELPATVVGEGAYQGLFNSCTSLIEAPKLPAMTLGANAYNSLFVGCASLTKAPDLPATTLAPYCYANMFGWCTRLSEAMGVLPATHLASYCYRQMFKQCKALRKAPILPATTMLDHAYEEMFTDAGLTEVPALPAQELAEFCYGGMFMNNASLEKIPLNYLTATTLFSNCYQWMFKGCTALKCGTRLPATTLASQCYAHMYDSCTALTDSERISAETLASGAFNQCFKNCTNLCRLWIPNMTAFDESATPSWMSGLSNLTRAFVCNASLDVSTRNESRIPEGWIATRSAYTADAMINRWSVTVDSFTFCPASSEQNWIYVNGNLTLNAINLPSGYVGSAQAYICWNAAVTATVSAGTGIDLIDVPHKGYLSHVLVTWEGLGTAKFRVMWESAL